MPANIASKYSLGNNDIHLPVADIIIKQFDEDSNEKTSVIHLVEIEVVPIDYLLDDLP